MTIEEENIVNDILREVNQILFTPYQREVLVTQTAKWIDHNVQELIDHMKWQ